MILSTLGTLTVVRFLTVYVCVPGHWVRGIVLLYSGQKFQKIRNRGGGVDTSTQTTQRTEMEVRKGGRKHKLNR